MLPSPSQEYCGLRSVVRMLTAQREFGEDARTATYPERRILVKTVEVIHAHGMYQQGVEVDQKSAKVDNEGDYLAFF